MLVYHTCTWCMSLASTYPFCPLYMAPRIARPNPRSLTAPCPPSAYRCWNTPRHWIRKPCPGFHTRTPRPPSPASGSPETRHTPHRPLHPLAGRISPPPLGHKSDSSRICRALCPQCNPCSALLDTSRGRNPRTPSEVAYFGKRRSRTVEITR